MDANSPVARLLVGRSILAGSVDRGLDGPCSAVCHLAPIPPIVQWNALQHLLVFRQSSFSGAGATALLATQDGMDKCLDLQ